LIPLAAGLACAAFIVMFRWLGIARITRNMMAEGRCAANVLGNRDISEDQKEQEIRQASLRMFGGFFQFTARTLTAFLVPVGLLFAIDILGVADMDEVFAFLLKWEVIAVSFILATFIWWFRK